MSANFVGKAIGTYTPYDVTSSRPRKTKIAFFGIFGGIKKITLHAGPELKFENYESVQHRLQFSGIKKGVKFHFIGTLRVRMGPGKPGQSWSFISRTFQSWKVLEIC